MLSSISHIEIKSISTTHKKTKLSSMLTLKPSDFRPAFKNQAHFDHSHTSQVNRPPHKKQFIFVPHEKTKSIAIPALKPSQFRSIHENQTIIGPNTTKSILTPRTKSQLRSPHKKVDFDLHTKNRSSSILHTKTKLISTPSLKSSQSRSPL